MPTPTEKQRPVKIGKFRFIDPTKRPVKRPRNGIPLNGLSKHKAQSKAVNKRNTWNRRFLELAKHISTWSKDPSTKVGAVLVDDNNHVIGTGYNGFPKGCDDHPALYLDRAKKYKRVVHAEVNAILIAGHRTNGCRLFVYPSFANPNICCECCKIAIQAGVKEIVGYKAENIRQDWEPSLDAAKQMCKEAKIKVTVV